jgi:cytoskeletal protein CcmA (bactofilin family)
MFSSNKPAKGGSPSQRAPETSLIASGTAITGNVRFSGALHLDGTIEGSVQAEPDSQAVFTLSEHGRVNGEIRVPHAVINGVVKGDIHAGEKLELASQARVEGNVHYNVLEMAAGAQVNGKMTHGGASGPQRQLAAPEEEPQEA